MKTQQILVFGWWCLLLLVGCTATVPLTHYYTLPTQPSHADSHSPQYPYILGIETFEADAPYQQDYIVFRKSAYEVNFYEYHRWLRPPTDLVMDSVRQYLEQSGKWERVHTYEMESYSDYTLRGKIELFDHWFEENSSSQTRIRILYQVFDSDTSKIVWMERVNSTAPIANLDMADKINMVDVVKGFEAALQDNIRQVMVALDNALQHR